MHLIECVFWELSASHWRPASSYHLSNVAVRVLPGHTCEWNSAWDERLIRGKWIEAAGGAIILLKAQEGKVTPAQGRAEVSLWDQNAIWYHGTPLTR